MRFYAACLASYNNGVLHGAWIDASTDEDEMQDAINVVLRSSRFPNVTVAHPETGEQVPSAEEWAVHDYDGVPPSFGEYPGLSKIAAYAQLVEDNDSIDEEDLYAIVDYFSGDPSETAEALRDRFSCICPSFKEYAEEQADDMMAAHDIKDDHPLARYFDYDQWTRELQMDMTTVDVPSGVAVFHS